jgi:hypothetical protein
MSWEVGFPATTLEELLLALIVRDLVHGASYDVEGADGIELEIDFSAGDELEGDAYHLVLSAEVHGPEDREFIHRLTQQMLDDTVDEAERLAAARTELGERGVDELEFRRVAEDGERWDLVVPDWFAPDGAEVPFGFRVFDARTGDLWPTDELLRAHGRIVAVPFTDRLHLFGIPAPEGADPAADSLPIHPRGG